MIFKKTNTDNYDLQKVQDSVAASLTDVDKKTRGISNEYDLVMPRYAPASKLPLLMDSEGNVTAEAFKTPTIQKFTTGTGTYTTPANVKWIQVRMVGGGGGGAGSATIAGANGGTGGTGGDTTFGTSLLSAGGGVGGLSQNNVSARGGTASISTPAIGTALRGGYGGGGGATASAIGFPGGQGGSSAFGGAGSGSGSSIGGTNAEVNTGGGGGGGAAGSSGGFAGGGGGSGGYVSAIIPSPLASSYAYAIGAQGAAGTAGTGGTAGGAGGSGYIEVTEFYQ